MWCLAAATVLTTGLFSIGWTIVCGATSASSPRL
jgi:hypothetical protein